MGPFRGGGLKKILENCVKERVICLGQSQENKGRAPGGWMRKIRGERRAECSTGRGNFFFTEARGQLGSRRKKERSAY